MTSAALAGSTGLVGSNILATILSLPQFTALHAFSRRDLPHTSEKLHPITTADSSTWSTLFPPSIRTFFSALGTTRAAAGGLANQRKVDHDLAVSLATAAKHAGVTTYVLISSGGANPHSYFPYMKMKGETEEAVKALGFEHTVIVRPGMIAGQREKAHSVLEAVLRGAAAGAGRVSNSLKDFWAQDADMIARAAVHAAVLAEDGKAPKGCEKVWVLGMGDIVRLGRTEWGSMSAGKA